MFRAQKQEQQTVVWEIVNPITLSLFVEFAKELGAGDEPRTGLSFTLNNATPEQIAVVEEAAASNGIVLMRHE